MRDARLMRRGGTPHSQIAAVLGFNLSTVQQAVVGKTWAHVGDPPPVRQRQKYKRLTADIVRQARQMRVEGREYPQIAAALGVKTATIQQAVIGKTWAHVVDPPPLPRRSWHRLTPT